MKYTLAAALFALFCYAAVGQAIDISIIDKVNKHPKASWKAGENDVFKGKSMKQVQHMLGSHTKSEFHRSAKKASNSLRAQDIPASFDAAAQWPQCQTITTVFEQPQKCAASWTFVATSVFSDRVCIATGGEVNEMLSMQDALVCNSKNYFGCYQPAFPQIWQYFERVGLVTEKCLPFSVKEEYKSPNCSLFTHPFVCDDQEVRFWKFTSVPGSVQSYPDVIEAQAEIMKNGPIQSAIKVYSDFYNYKSGVYRHVEGVFTGTLSIKVTGWGVDEKTKTPYWLATTSWGAGFGEKGFFKIVRGENECEVEENMFVGQVSAA